MIGEKSSRFISPQASLLTLFPFDFPILFPIKMNNKKITRTSHYIFMYYEIDGWCRNLFNNTLNKSRVQDNFSIWHVQMIGFCLPIDNIPNKINELFNQQNDNKFHLATMQLEVNTLSNTPPIKKRWRNPVNQETIVNKVFVQPTCDTMPTRQRTIG